VGIIPSALLIICYWFVLNSADMWMQHIERECPDVQVVVSRLEADAPGQSELCKSLRELCLKMLQR
jgi:hypothetical protein